MMGFNNIIGHEEIIGHLKNAIESGKISHSYIFTGEPGSGKKLLAGTFAATLQCEAGGTEPCQKCDSCKKAMGKNHPDIIMVSHEKPGTITIDEIRDQVINDIYQTILQSLQDLYYCRCRSYDTTGTECSS